MGVPVWIVLGVVVVGLIVYEKKKSSTSTKATASTATGTQAGYGAAGQGAPGGLGYGLTGPQNLLEQSLQANAGQATTNPQWEANAESVLVGYGYPFVQVQSALNVYLAGGTLSSVQREIVNAAIEAVGAPPSPPGSTASTASPTTATPATATPVAPTQAAPAPAAAAPAPVATAAPAAPAGQTYTVVSGDTLWGIATRFYGNGALWPRIYNANKGVIGGNPNLIYPGQVYTIPPA